MTIFFFEFPLNSSLITMCIVQLHLSYSAPLLDSPLAYTNVHQRMFRILNIFDYQSESPFWTKYHGPFICMLRAFFIYFGCTLQAVSVFKCSSIVELCTVLFVVSEWVNICVKDITFLVKKREIKDLWQQFDDNDFKAKTSGEYE